MPEYLLGIESSCDDTSAAVIQDGYLLSNVIASQQVHKEYGGVVPELASRAHEQNIVPVVSQALQKAGIGPGDLSAIAFTRGPGLLGSLLVGTSFATSAYLIWNLYLAGNDRLSESSVFKILMLTVSGVISLIVCTNSFHRLFYEKLVMGEQVVHGKLFLPCLLIVYGTLFVGWIVSIVHIIRKENERIYIADTSYYYPEDRGISEGIKIAKKIASLVEDNE